MIIHLKINEVCDFTIGVTKKMKEDMISCENGFSVEKYPDCKKCSWNHVKVGNEDLCMVHSIRAAVLNNERNVTYYGEQ